ncbi:hypothetical protein D3273_12290 [Lichenibacterium minor]|uniref:Protein ImuA n=1 Tax=Lichenibacterium minor TaxID=2316528 RepID=A0A4Q2U5G3_9HYPH|nr:hypothetical protein [Lichenibacterium minor]RYC31652.1 hypothetical protein D3273_12290 [Lichenibacterium minor]
MPQDHPSPDVAALRGVVARIEAGRSGPPRRTGPAGPATVSLGDGALPLDAALGGGLRRGALHEVVAENARDAAAAAGFALAAAGRCSGAAPLVWIVEDPAAAETGAPYRPGLAAHGIDPDRLILVRTADGQATLWALEEALRLGAPAVLAELWGAKHYGLAPSRRLLLAAQGGRGAALLLHAGLAGRGAGLSSAAETRLVVAACPSPHLASAGTRLPIPGPAAVAVRVLKLRLGGDAGLDRDRRHPIVWNQHRRCFDAHPLPVGVPAPAADRPGAPRRAAAVVAFGNRAG